MADEIKRLKNLRKFKSSAFTRKQNQLQSLVDSNADGSILEEIYAELKTTFKAVEDAHEAYVCVVDENVLEEEGDYLAVPSAALNTLFVKVKELSLIHI